MQLKHTSDISSGVVFLLSLAFHSAAHSALNETDLIVSYPPDALFSRQADSTSLTSDTEFRTQELNGHNWFRVQHSASPLTWDNELASSSMAWAKRCVFKHSGTKGVGENIAAGYANIATSVNGWGLERIDYSFNNPGFSSGTGHFTQMVWQSTSSLGCGRSKCLGMGWFVVCQYAPPGNFNGESYYTANVAKQNSGSPSIGWDGKSSDNMTRPPGASASDTGSSNSRSTGKPTSSPDTSTSKSASRSISNIVYTSDIESSKSGNTSGDIYTTPIDDGTGRLTSAAESNPEPQNALGSTMGSGVTKGNANKYRIIMGLVVVAAAAGFAMVLN